MAGDTSKLSQAFSKAASAIARATGRPSAFVLCGAVVIVWAVTGPIFGFSDTWQLVINTGTTIVTFLMVFLIQNTQNRDAAIHLKLDELIRASTAQNAFVGMRSFAPDVCRMQPPPADQPLHRLCDSVISPTVWIRTAAAISSEPRTRFAIMLARGAALVQDAG